MNNFRFAALCALFAFVISALWLSGYFGSKNDHEFKMECLRSGGLPEYSWARLGCKR